MPKAKDMAMAEAMAKAMAMPMAKAMAWPRGHGHGLGLVFPYIVRGAFCTEELLFHPQELCSHFGSRTL